MVNLEVKLLKPIFFFRFFHKSVVDLASSVGAPSRMSDLEKKIEIIDNMHRKGGRLPRNGRKKLPTFQAEN